MSPTCSSICVWGGSLDEDAEQAVTQTNVQIQPMLMRHLYVTCLWLSKSQRDGRTSAMTKFAWAFTVDVPLAEPVLKRKFSFTTML